MSATKESNLERQKRRERLEDIISVLESLGEERLREFEERGLSDEELATMLLELAMESDGPTEFFGEPVSTNLQQEFFSSKASPI